MSGSVQAIRLVPGEVDLATLRRIYQEKVTLQLAEEARADIDRARETVEAIVASGKVVYGINTGFGKLAQTQIPAERLAELQRNLVLSHSVGLGDLLPDNVTRLVVASKIISLARGHSGIRMELIDALLALFNAGVMPCIPAKGSVGASGDLAPLAHLSLMLLGEGQVRIDGQLLPAREGLAHVGLQPIVLGPKEGLALLNGTQVSTALALRGLFEAENLFAAGLMAGALSLEAIKGSVKPFDARIHQARGQHGQIAVAAAVATLLEGSEILSSHSNCGRVQDPYSIRCVPQVMGACLDNLSHAARVLQIEANAASDNPLVFSDSGDVIVRWQLPRRAGGLCRRHHRAGDCRSRCHLRTPPGAAARHRSLRPAALPGARRRRELGLHDCAGYRCRAGLGEQIAGAPGQRRQPADLSQSGRSRIDGHLRSTASGRDVLQHRCRGRH